MSQVVYAGCVEARECNNPAPRILAGEETVQMAALGISAETSSERELSIQQRDIPGDKAWLGVDWTHRTPP